MYGTGNTGLFDCQFDVKRTFAESGTLASVFALLYDLAPRLGRSTHSPNTTILEYRGTAAATVPRRGARAARACVAGPPARAVDDGRSLTGWH
jgi:hypothetical protein